MDAVKRSRISIFAKSIICLTAIFTASSIFSVLILDRYKLTELKNELSARVGAYAARVAATVDDLDWQKDKPVIRRVVDTLLADRAIECAEIGVPGDSPEAIVVPTGVGCQGVKGLKRFEIPLVGPEGATLSVGFSTGEIAQFRHEANTFAALIACFSCVLSLAASLIGFRKIIGKPVERLLRAIEETTNTGRFGRVEEFSGDELGQVAAAFNSMQSRLREERANTESAWQLINHIYHATPTLMFSMDAAGVVVRVSRHCSQIIGAPVADIIGRGFEMWLAADSQARFIDDVIARLAANGEVRDVPLELACNHSSPIGIILSAVKSKMAGHAGDEYLCVMSDVTTLLEAHRKLQEVAYADHLTGLPNRVALSEYLGGLIETHARGKEVVACLFVDVDKFKWVNDRYGHAAGDAVLIEVANRVRAALRPDDYVSRLSGDEFVVVCRNLTDENEALSIARAINQQFHRHVEAGGAQVFVSVSVGVALLTNEMTSFEEALGCADRAMYQAKEEGRDRYSSFTPAIDRNGRAKAEVLNAIHEGFDNGWFSLRYQPLVDLKDFRVVGAEALVRLQRPGHDPSPTPDMIRVAEESGQINRLGSWVLEEASRQFDALARLGVHDIYVAINVSASQLGRELLGSLREIVAKYPVLVGRLVIEITESAMIAERRAVLELLKEVKKLGVRIAVDDFGTGYSCLSQISSLPIDIIKLDQSFIQGLEAGSATNEEDRRRMALVRATVALARELDVDVVAEGIQTGAELTCAQQLGISVGQGYAISPPLSEGAYIEWVRAFHRRSPDGRIDTRDMAAAQAA
jgi:diguanylate cyclase (GGDEF)-like protein